MVNALSWTIWVVIGMVAPEFTYGYHFFPDISSSKSWRDGLMAIIKECVNLLIFNILS